MFKLHYLLSVILSAVMLFLVLPAPALATFYTQPMVAAGYEHTVGLKSDGTVVAVGYYDLGQTDVGGWTDIIQVAAGHLHTVGLKSDGTVVAVGWNGYGQTNVSGWTGIIQVAAGLGHTVGLKSDGTVVAVGWSEVGQTNVSGWTDIIQVAAGWAHTVGLKSDGTIAAVGYIVQTDVSGWELIDVGALFNAFNALQDQVSTLTAQVSALNQQITQLQSQITNLTQQNQALQTQVNTLSAQNTQLQNQVNQLTTGLVSGLNNLQNDFRVTFNNPTFVISGATPSEQYQNLINAILNLNKGRKEGLYTNLGGKPGK
jgi:alpha-tubulin suppressor-like RCC1 family protein